MPFPRRLSRKSHSLRRSLLVAALALVVVLASLLIVAHYRSPQVPSSGAAGAGDRLFPTLGNGGYDVGHYWLDFDIRDPGKPFDGTVTIEATATQSLSRFSLDLLGSTVRDVTVDGRQASYGREGEKLLITPAAPISADRSFRVIIGYTVEPAWQASDSAWLIEPDGFALDGQPVGAHSVLPCNDIPSDKALFTIRLHVPNGVMAVANGTLTNEKSEGGRTASTFSSTSPMATELIQIAVGPYTVLRQAGPHGLALRHVVPPDQAGQLKPVVERTPEQINWLERRLGPYPFEVYGILAVAKYPEDGLESQTLPLFDASYLTGDPATAGPLMVHELAHQWFGDSVTPRTWSDLWLNEAHATWYEWLYATEHGWRPPGGQAADFEGRMRETYAKGDRWRKRYGPVAQPISADKLFNQNVYDGGALVLYALQSRIGVGKFDQLERAWVSEHQAGVVSTADFISLASRIAGEDLTDFLNAWLYGTRTPPMPGHPDWTVDKVD
jgi:aminopeptidase N